MSCYLRHLDDVLLAAGIRRQRGNQQRLHAIIRELTGEEECPRVWRRVQSWLVRGYLWVQGYLRRPLERERVPTQAGADGPH